MRAPAAAAALTIGLATGAAAAPAPPAGPALAFPVVRSAWAAGRGGILGTRDGTTWRLQLGRPVTALDAVDADTAWALSGRTLYATTDGLHWRRTGTPGLAAMDFVDATTGFALSPAGRLLRSRNAGASWRRLRAPSALDALCFSTPRRGWIAHEATVWRTANGGVTWARTRFLPARGGFPRPELGCDGTAVWALFHRGVAAGSEGYVVFRSLDGGRTWRGVLAGLDQTRPRLPAISAYSGPFAALGRAAVFAGSCAPCRNGRGTTTVVRTTNGGRTWRRTTLRLDGYPTAVAFADASHGRLVLASPRTHRGTVLVTANGGRTWRAQLHSGRLAP